jgi:hypothetical protein
MRQRVNKRHLYLHRLPELFPYGALSIVQGEEGKSLKELGVRAYKNDDDTLTLELPKIIEDGKPVSHTFTRDQWGIRKPRQRKNRR